MALYDNLVSVLTPYAQKINTVNESLSDEFVSGAVSFPGITFVKKTLDSSGEMVDHSSRATNSQLMHFDEPRIITFNSGTVVMLAKYTSEDVFVSKSSYSYSTSGGVIRVTENDYFRITIYTYPESASTVTISELVSLVKCQTVADAQTEQTRVSRAILARKPLSYAFSTYGCYGKGTDTYYATSGTYYTTDFIALEDIKYTEFVYEFPSTSSAAKVTLFDSNKEYVGYSMDATDYDSLLEIAPTAVYARFTMSSTVFANAYAVDKSNQAAIDALETELDSRIDANDSDIEYLEMSNMFAHMTDPTTLFTETGYYTKATGTYNSGSGSYKTTDYIPLEYLDKTYLSYTFSSSASANKVTLFNANKEYVGYSMSKTDKPSLLEIAPTAVYARFSCTTANLAGLKLAYVASDSVLPLSANIFMRVGVIGDSYTAGYINIDGLEHSNNTYPDYSWVAFMNGLTGRTWTNFGKGGSSTKSWIEGTSGLTRLSEVQADGAKCQAYVIGLGINDISHSATNVALGTSDDIGTDADSYYAYYYKLVHAIYDVNNDAKIFCNTLPKFSLTNVTGYNQAVADIVDYCKNEGISIFLVDLAGEYYTDELYANAMFTDDLINGHYTAICYNFMAQCYHKVLSKVINENISDMQDVFLIDYDTPT